MALLLKVIWIGLLWHRLRISLPTCDCCKVSLVLQIKLLQVSRLLLNRSDATLQAHACFALGVLVFLLVIHGDIVFCATLMLVQAAPSPATSRHFPTINA